MFLLSHLSTLWVGVLVVGATMAVSLGMLLIVRRTAPHRGARDDVIGNVFQTLGGIYGILLGFVVFVVWSSQQAAAQNVRIEAMRIEALYQDALGLPEASSGPLRELTATYARLVIDEEWDLMALGQESPRVAAVAQDLLVLYTRIEPRSEKESAIFAESLGEAHQLVANRRARLSSADDELPAVMWFVLVAGYVVVIGLVCSFGIQNAGSHVLLTALASLFFGLMLFLIMVLNHPFNGDVRVSPGPIAQVLTRMTPPPAR